MNFVQECIRLDALAGQHLPTPILDHNFFLCNRSLCCLGPSNDNSEDVSNAWDIMDIMNNVSSVHNCVEHKNQKCGIGSAFDSLNREK